MPEMHQNSLDFFIVLVDHSQKNKERIQNLNKQETQNIFTEMSLIKLVFNMTWLMEILKN